MNHRKDTDSLIKSKYGEEFGAAMHYTWHVMLHYSIFFFNHTYYKNTMLKLKGHSENGDFFLGGTSGKP